MERSEQKNSRGIEERSERPEDMVEIYDKVLSPQARTSKRFKPVIEKKTYINRETKEEVEVEEIVGYEAYTVPFRERHLIDETTSNLTRQDKNLVRIDRQLCTLFQLLSLDYGIDMETAYDYFFENASDELNLSKSVEGWGIMAMRTTKQYQEGKLETRQNQLNEQEKKGFWGLLKK